MKKTVLSLIFCIASVCATQSIEATQSHKQYVLAREIAFRDGHFRLKRQGNPVLKLKNLRANDSGIYYLPKDVFVGEETGNGDGSEKIRLPGRYRPDARQRPMPPPRPDDEVYIGRIVEKRHGRCVNRPTHSEHHYRNPGRKPNGVPGGRDRWDPGANGPAGR